MDQLTRALAASDRWAPDYSVESVLLSLLLAFVLGQLVAWVYSWTHTGLSYSRTFTQSLVLMAMVVTLVMFVIGNSVVTAFGLIGAMAIIRFRNVLKDTRDTVFIFFVLMLGLATGSQRYATALIGTAAFALAAVYLHGTRFGGLGRFDGHLRVRLATGGEESLLDEALRRFCSRAKAVSVRQGTEIGGPELLYQVRLRDLGRSGELLATLDALAAVEHSSLVLRDDLTEV